MPLVIAKYVHGRAWEGFLGDVTHAMFGAQISASAKNTTARPPDAKRAPSQALYAWVDHYSRRGYRIFFFVI